MSLPRHSPVLERLLHSPSPFCKSSIPNIKACQALILAPTRELAQQIQKVVVAIGDFMSIDCHACIGGTSVRDDMTALQAGPQVVVGTPGRVQDMIQRRVLKTDSMKMFVLDEADEMLSVSAVCYHNSSSLCLQNFSGVSPSKSTISSNSFLSPPRSFFFPPPCPKTFSRSPPSSCVILSVSWSKGRVDPRGYQAVLYRC